MLLTAYSDTADRSPRAPAAGTTPATPLQRPPLCLIGLDLMAGHWQNETDFTACQHNGFWSAC